MTIHFKKIEDLQIEVYERETGNIGLIRPDGVVMAVGSGDPGGFWYFELANTGIELRVYDERESTRRHHHKREWDDLLVTVQDPLWALDMAEEIEQAFKDAGTPLDDLHIACAAGFMSTRTLVVTDEDQRIRVRTSARKPRQKVTVSQKTLDGAVDMQATLR